MSDHKNIAESKLDDLAFEIAQGGEAKFLIAVCDDLLQARTIRSTLKRLLRNRGKNIVFVSLRSLLGDFLPQVFRFSKAGTVDAIALWGFLTAADTVSDSMFRNLNFHRDTITKLRIPFILWVRSEQLTRLASIAPDFWSRRTAVYRFTTTSSKELLKRLFTSTVGAHAPKTKLASAVEKILAAERQLGKCLRRRSFSFDQPDECLRIIHTGLAELYTQCSNGKQIDVALLLWSVAHLDGELQQSIERLSNKDRNVYEYLYTDRNEALLHTAQKMEEILAVYERSLNENVSKKRASSLVYTFRRVAIDKLNAIASDLQSYVGASTRAFEYWLREAEQERDDFAGSRIEHTFGAQASYELESWLSGYNDERPVFFTSEEGRMLKILYSSDTPVEDLCQELSMSPRSVKAQIRHLEEKVRMFLMTAEKQLSSSQIKA